MRAGALHNLIAIQARTQTGTNDLNEPIYTWTTLRECFAAISTRRGVENFDPGSQQRYSEVVYRFRVRFEDAKGVGATMVIVFEGQTYNITGILADYDRREDAIIECILQEGVVT